MLYQDLNNKLIRLGFKLHSRKEGTFLYKDSHGILYTAYLGSFKSSCGSYVTELVCISNSVTENMSKNASDVSELEERFEEVKREAVRNLNLNKLLE